MLATFVAGLMLSACGKTTIVAVSTTTTTVVGETTTLPRGTVAELLARLRSEAFTLSGGIGDGNGRDILQSITSLWEAAREQLPRTAFVEDVQHQIDLMTNAVDRKRPGDADKAALHLASLIDAFAA